MLALVIALVVLLLVAVWWIFRQHHNVKLLSEEIGRFQDELKEKGRLLEQKETEIARFFNSVDITAISYDKAQKQLDIAKGVEQIYGFTQSEFLKIPTLWLDVIHPDDKDGVRKKLRKLKAGDKLIIEHRIIRADLKIRWVAVRLTVVLDPSDKVEKVIGVVFDITERKHMEDQLKQLAYHDELTDLPNRTSLKKHLKKAMARSKRHEHDLSVMFIDLDGFKNVNDTLGHDAGDELLKEVSARLDDIVREEDLVARHGGDEFIVVFEDTGEIEVESIARRIVDGLSAPYEIGGETASISPSIGISIYPRDGEDSDILIHNADKAMYAVKCNGKSGYEFYRPEHADIQPKKTVIEKFVDLFTW